MITNKPCDAADWFKPELIDVITNELREVPRFHRKQWELAMILLALRERGKLHPDAVGLSMGGGVERILYALAPHIGSLIVTDLYDPESGWECAQTDDPVQFVHRHKPFPVDLANLQALRMDMRSLEFPDRSFDFCYSSCAVEHIGSWKDFAAHFDEVARVLKDDGVYVFTTEINYGSETIEDDHNFVFALPDLLNVLHCSNLALEGDFDARITPNKINHPRPANVHALAFGQPEPLAARLLRDGLHVQLLRGKHPFTAGMFILRKRTALAPLRSPVCVGIEPTRAFMSAALEEYRSVLDQTALSIDPYSSLPHGISPFCVDHVEFVSSQPAVTSNQETVFHSDYFWFGSGRRVFDVRMEVVHGEQSIVELRIHRYPTLSSATVDCAVSSSVMLQADIRQVHRFILDTDDDHQYAVLAKVRRGSCRCATISIESYPATIAPTISVPVNGPQISQTHSL
jgi:SAM-dependent methyltransferase